MRDLRIGGWGCLPDSLNRPLQVTELALPDDLDVIPQAPECSNATLVPGLVGFELVEPDKRFKRCCTSPKWP